MPLTNFWRRYCNPALTPHRDLPDIWRLELKLANRPREEVVLSDDDDEDLAVFIYESDVADPRPQIPDLRMTAPPAPTQESP